MRQVYCSCDIAKKTRRFTNKRSYYLFDGKYVVVSPLVASSFSAHVHGGFGLLVGSTAPTASARVTFGSCSSITTGAFCTKVVTSVSPLLPPVIFV